LTIYIVIKWIWFGYPFPNTYYIKRGGFLTGEWYVKRYLIALSPILLYLGFAAGRVGLARLVKDRTFAILALPAIAFVLAYLNFDVAVGAAELGYRFLAPTLPLLTLACLRAHVLSNAGAAPLRGAFAFYAVVMLLTVGYFAREHRETEYASMKLQFQGVRSILIPTGQLLDKARELTPPPLLATGDVGAIPYFSGLPTVDLEGLADETVAHSGLTHEYLEKQKPDLLILQDLYVVPVARDADAQSLQSQVVIQLRGHSYTLNRDRYTKGIKGDPARAHSGAASTYQVVTMPSFAHDYAHAAQFDFGGDVYFVFVRRDYSNAAELTTLVQTIAQDFSWGSAPTDSTSPQGK
jgi:hypothetical protein